MYRFFSQPCGRFSSVDKPGQHESNSMFQTTMKSNVEFFGGKIIDDCFKKNSLSFVYFEMYFVLLIKTNCLFCLLFDDCVRTWLTTFTLAWVLVELIPGQRFNFGNKLMEKVMEGSFEMDRGLILNKNNKLHNRN